ncbi:TetR/AcrR family transcriptional regulator [Pseudochelatococcus sp. B33]
MPRVKKTPETRSTELLDCAQRLFFERGYDHTTVNDIIREAGLSKGAFYHYFASKEALLEALAARLARDSLAELQPIVDAPSLDAVGRLNALFAGAQQFNIELAPQLRQTFAMLFRPENVVLFHRTDQAGRALALPLIAGILRQGNEEGAFDVPDPETFADMLLQLRLIVRDIMYQALCRAANANVEAVAQTLDDRLRLYGVAIDRLLKLPDGTIKVVEPGFGRAFLGTGG